MFQPEFNLFCPLYPNGPVPYSPVFQPRISPCGSSVFSLIAAPYTPVYQSRIPSVAAPYFIVIQAHIPHVAGVAVRGGDRVRVGRRLPLPRAIASAARHRSSGTATHRSVSRAVAARHRSSDTSTHRSVPRAAERYRSSDTATHLSVPRADAPYRSNSTCRGMRNMSVRPNRIFWLISPLNFYHYSEKCAAQL